MTERDTEIVDRIEDRLQGYEAGRVSLETLISDLDLLLVALRCVKLKRNLRDEWEALELRRTAEGRILDPVIRRMKRSIRPPVL